LTPKKDGKVCWADLYLEGTISADDM